MSVIERTFRYPYGDTSCNSNGISVSLLQLQFYLHLVIIFMPKRQDTTEIKILICL